MVEKPPKFGKNHKCTDSKVEQTPNRKYELGNPHPDTSSSNGWKQKKYVEDREKLCISQENNFYGY